MVYFHLHFYRKPPKGKVSETDPISGTPAMCQAPHQALCVCVTSPSRHLLSLWEVPESQVPVSVRD